MDKQPEEYHFGKESELEQEHEPAEESMMEQPIRRRSKLASPKFWVPIVLVIAVIGTMQYMNYRAKEAKQVPTAAEKAEQRQAFSARERLRLAVNEARQQAAANKQAISQLQGQLQGLTSQMTQMNNNLTSLSASITGLAAEVKALKAKPAPPRVVHREVRRHIIKVEMPKYHVEALVPGRAWLATQRGTAVTVRVGDSLPGYGRVTNINVPYGIVTTSSGQLIRYGRDDS